ARGAVRVPLAAEQIELVTDYGGRAAAARRGDRLLLHEAGVRRIELQRGRLEPFDPVGAAPGDVDLSVDRAGRAVFLPHRHAGKFLPRVHRGVVDGDVRDRVAGAACATEQVQLVVHHRDAAGGAFGSGGQRAHRVP